ncbi:MAG: hypothetical protein A2X49_07265 [Lentisphaerae bacterium GWF2_52_8]|nr:MAG: hypothetical protein A2X49_07265 [Lentisphaerae bacterium GWF2_52_8]
MERLKPVRSILVFLSSVLTIFLSLALAFFLRFELSFPEKEMVSFPKVLIAVLAIKLLVFWGFRLYEGMWRYVSIPDLMRILWANIVASGILAVIVLLWHDKVFLGFARSVLLLDFMICFLMMSGKRVLTRVIRESASRTGGDRNLRTILVGSTESVNSLIQALSASPGRRQLVGVLCPETKIRHTIRGIPVLGVPESAAKCAKKHRASEIMLLPPYSTPAYLRELMDELEKREVKCALRMLPSYADIADGRIQVSQIREVEIEDLLGRQPVRFDKEEVAAFVKGKVVMVTGGGGSIGSELCRQIGAYKPGKLIIFDISEYNVYENSMSLEALFPELELVRIVADVRSEICVREAITKHGVEIVYHAAAYKHVPLMEENVASAFDVNVLGTANLVNCCEKHGVKRMVMVSTDKAVRPTSVMGSTKRIAERIILERPSLSTEFVVVRFGNVLGSSGSVIPLFKKQIRAGGPVTVTSENVVRYFMSIPEAVELVLQAGAIGHDRDIMVLEMGEPVRIYDMARKLIELSGLTPGSDIEIKFVGLRPGEKEYEELLTDQEKVERTPFDRICVARKEETPAVPVDIGIVRPLVAGNDYEGLRNFIRANIPENLLGEAGIGA